jgi:hypothetical protein
LEEARRCKNASDWKQGIEHLVVGHSYAVATDRMMPKRELHIGRLFRIGLATGGLVLGYLIPALAKLLFH